MYFTAPAGWTIILFISLEFGGGSSFLGGMIVARPTSAVDNIVLRLLPNSSSYEDGMSFFIGVVLYVLNAVYEHFYSSWACFQRALIVLIALSATQFGDGMLCLSCDIPS